MWCSLLGLFRLLSRSPYYDELSGVLLTELVRWEREPCPKQAKPQFIFAINLYLDVSFICNKVLVKRLYLSNSKVNQMLGKNVARVRVLVESLLKSINHL